MTQFEWLSWLSSFLTLGGIFAAVLMRPYLLVKPSFLVVVFLHFTNQLSSAAHAAEIEARLIAPWDYFILVQLFPPIALLLSTITFRREARWAWSIAVRTETPAHTGTPPLVALLAATAFVLVWYFSEVPYQKMGLYAVLFDPATATMARENSMKLIGSAPLKYAFALMSTVLVPLAAVLTAFRLEKGLGMRCLGTILVSSMILVGLLVCGSVYGARGPSAMVLLTVAFAFFLRRRLFFKPVKIVLAVALCLFVPTVMTLLRDGADWTVANFASYFVNVIDRVFGRAIEDGIWQVDYVQRNGFFGLPGIGTPARLLGFDYVNTFNTVGLKYSTSGIASVSANTTFVIAYYGCFGLIAFVPCLVLLLMLDAVLVSYRMIKPALVLPCLAACQIAATNLGATFFTTIFFTYGFLVIPITGIFLGRLPRIVVGGRPLLRSRQMA